MLGAHVLDQQMDIGSMQRWADAKVWVPSLVTTCYGERIGEAMRNYAYWCGAYKQNGRL